MRTALRTIIEDEVDLQLVAEVDNGKDAVIQTLALNPDVAVVDLYIPVVEGMQVIEQIAAANPETHTLVLTSSIAEDKVAEAILAGALGYLLKDSDRDEILFAIREVGVGRAYLSPHAASKLANSLRQRQSQSSATTIEPLTPREQEVLDRVAAGASNTDIARDLQIGETTVRTHIHNVVQKMGFETRSQLMMHLLNQKSRR
ncbi:MAG: response regulator transcription factor [Anaerolineales bacterium]|nr:response regulator transcription factor [Anaerolineales bacterium]